MGSKRRSSHRAQESRTPQQAAGSPGSTCISPPAASSMKSPATILAGVAVLLGMVAAGWSHSTSGGGAARRLLLGGEAEGWEEPPPAMYTLEIVNSYHHDPTAFSQGLTYEDPDILLESVGLHGHSDVREVDLHSGQVLRRAPNLPRDFGEGLVDWHGTLVQLIWQSGRTIMWNRTTLEVVRETQTPLRDGWGLTHDNTHLIATDNGDHLFFLDPETLQIDRKVQVTDHGVPLPWLNELEYIEGEVWANLWQTDCIARIDPGSGKVNGWILAEGITQSTQALRIPQPKRMDVLNGIAYDAANDRIFITGKLWPKLYEVRLLPLAPLGTRQELHNVHEKCVPMYRQRAANAAREARLRAQGRQRPGGGHRIKREGGLHGRDQPVWG